MEPEGTGLALIKHASARRDQIQTIWPAGVGSFNLVREVIYQCGKFYTQFADAAIGYGRTFLLVARTAEQHLVAHVALHLPDIGRVRFKNVDRVEIDLTLVLLRELVQGGNLPPKGRSGVTAKDQDHGFASPQGGKVDWGLGIERLHCEVRRSVSYLQ